MGTPVGLVATVASLTFATSLQIRVMNDPCMSRVLMMASSLSLAESRVRLKRLALSSALVVSQ